MTFYDSGKHQKTISKTAFWSNRKSKGKYLIKPVVYGAFLGQFRKKAYKSVQKALGFQLKLVVIYGFEKCQKSIGPRAFWSIKTGPSKYLIKPVEF